MPVMANLSDVPDVLQWLVEHDDEALAISLAGRRFIEEHASFDGAVAYSVFPINRSDLGV